VFGVRRRGRSGFDGVGSVVWALCARSLTWLEFDWLWAVGMVDSTDKSDCEFISALQRFGLGVLGISFLFSSWMI